MAVDVLSDAAESLIQAGADAALVRRVLRDIRKRWGGTQTYVNAVDRRERDAEIRRALEAGLHPDEAAKRAGCSPATIRRRRSAWL